MNQFGSLIKCALCEWDRLRFHASLRPLFSPQGMLAYLCAANIRLVDFAAPAQTLTGTPPAKGPNQPEIPRYDAGRALLLRGDGTGKLEALRGQESGLKVYGEQRGAAVADFDKDGRVDLVVSQNGAATKLFRNVRGKPGLRVRLLGPPGNPDAIGGQMRLFFGQRAGPVRELHAGSGYWSQDSLIQVLATPEPPTEIWIRWPGGKITTTALPEGAKEVSVALDGKLRPQP